MTWSPLERDVGILAADCGVAIPGRSGPWRGHPWRKRTVRWSSLEEADGDVAIPGGSGT